MDLYDPEGIRTFYNRYGDREWNRFETPVGRVQEHVILSFVDRHGGATAARERGDPYRVLDAGCGPGRFALPLLRLGARVTLVDLSDAMLEEAERRIRAEGLAAGLDGVYRQSYLDLDFLAEGCCDAVLCLGGSLNYMPERLEQALAGFRRLLRPGGVLVGGVMNALGSLRPALLAGWSPSDDGLRPDDLRRVVRDGVLQIDGRPISEHHARMFHLDGVRRALAASDLTFEGASATECLLDLPDDRLRSLASDPAWPALLEAEVLACARSPEAGGHVLFAASRPGRVAVGDA